MVDDKSLSFIKGGGIMDTTSQLKELEQFNRTFDSNISWQAKMENQLRKTPKGRYFSEIKKLAEQKDAALDRLYHTCSTRAEYDYCADKLNAWYHGQRLKAHEKYYKEMKKPLPTKESIFSGRTV